jgi:hypothetical protein
VGIILAGGTSTYTSKSISKENGGDSDILRRRNQQLTARVKELEEALTKATGATPGSTTTSDSRKTDDDDTAYDKEDDGLVESFGTLTIEETGRTIWHGKDTTP